MPGLVVLHIPVQEEGHTLVLVGLVIQALAVADMRGRGALRMLVLAGLLIRVLAAVPTLVLAELVMQGQAAPAMLVPVVELMLVPVVAGNVQVFVSK